MDTTPAPQETSGTFGMINRLEIELRSLEANLRDWRNQLQGFDRHDHEFTVGEIEDQITAILGDEPDE